MPSTPPGIAAGAFPARGARGATVGAGTVDGSGSTDDGAAGTPARGCASGMVAGASVGPPGVTMNVTSRTSSGVAMRSLG